MALSAYDCWVGSEHPGREDSLHVPTLHAHAFCSLPRNGAPAAARLGLRTLVEPQLQVLYTTSAFHELFAHALPLPETDEVVEKPFSEGELVDAVRRML